MPRTKSQKSEIVKKISQALKEAVSGVFVSFIKLTVKEMEQLRKLEREVGGRFLVVKKTLLSLALGELSPSGDKPELSGEIALAYGNDLISPAKAIAKFRKGREDKVSILGGIFEGRFASAAEMNEIANIPEKNILFGMFVNIINSPIQGLVIVLDAIVSKNRNP